MRGVYRSMQVCWGVVVVGGRVCGDVCYVCGCVLLSWSLMCVDLAALGQLCDELASPIICWHDGQCEKALVKRLSGAL